MEPKRGVNTDAVNIVKLVQARAQHLIFQVLTRNIAVSELSDINSSLHRVKPCVPKNDCI